MILLPTIIVFLIQILAVQSVLIDSPTLKPAQPFCASDDAEKIRKEMKSTPIDRSEIAKIIFHRVYSQRHEIDVYYNQKFCNGGSSDKCPLHSALKYISADSLDKLYNISLMPPEGILAQTIYNSIKEGNCEVGAIEEIVCANDKKMKDLISQYYNTTYQMTVEDHLATFRKDDQAYQNVMLKYCWKGLCQDAKITSNDADKEADALKDFHKKKDKEGFKKKLMGLLDTTCEPDLKQIFEKYRHDDKGIGEGVDDMFDITY